MHKRDAEDDAVMRDWIFYHFACVWHTVPPWNMIHNLLILHWSAPVTEGALL